MPGRARSNRVGSGQEVRGGIAKAARCEMNVDDSRATDQVESIVSFPVSFGITHRDPLRSSREQKVVLPVTSDPVQRLVFEA